jgi:antitoxin CptB
VSEPEDARLRRLRWQARRGMRELDLLLLGFLDGGGYQALTEEERAALEALLAQPDQLLLGFLLGQRRPADPRQARVVDSIRRHAHH